MARVKRHAGRKRAQKAVSLAHTPFGGDHGTGTAAMRAGTTLEALTDANGKNPNNMGRLRRVEVIDTLAFTMRQEQAAKAIRDAFCKVQMLSSGSALKERVQSSPKPDATIASQVDASSLWVYVMKPVKPVNRRIVEHVCCENRPMVQLSGYKQARKRLAQTLDAVADHIGY